MLQSAQYLLHWYEHPTFISSRLGYLLERQSHVDMTLMCDTHTVKVHRAVLAASSPYFERHLGNHHLIVFKDTKISVLKSLVEFMYYGETSVTEDNLAQLLEAAKLFEIAGLSSMTTETICGTQSLQSSISGYDTPTILNLSRGRKRGRGRPPLHMGAPAQARGPTELLSLSGTPTSQIFNSLKKDTSSSSSYTSSAPNLTSTPNLTSEPRRRGRKPGAVNAALRERLLREANTHLAIENLKRDLSDNDFDSPTLSSLLKKSKTDNKYLKDMNSTFGMDSEDQKSLNMWSLTGSKSIEEATLQPLTNGAVPEAENETQDLVLYEVTSEQQIEKHVLSAQEIALIKSLNEEITNQKKELSSLPPIPENEEKSAELKVKIEKTTALLAQVIGSIKEQLKIAISKSKQ